MGGRPWDLGKDKGYLRKELALSICREVGRGEAGTPCWGCLASGPASFSRLSRRVERV
jgi:hypothetical protein